MLTFEQIKELIDQVAEHRLTGVEVERSGFRLKIDGYKPAKAISAPTSTGGSPAPAAPNVLVGPAPAAATSAGGEAPKIAGDGADKPSSAAAPSVDEASDDIHHLTSPIVGTFYRAPNPETDAFVEVGSRVAKGQVLCIVEAMKLMNEIESDTDGVVVEIFPKNAQAVEYGERLFAIKAD